MIKSTIGPFRFRGRKQPNGDSPTESSIGSADGGGGSGDVSTSRRGKNKSQSNGSLTEKSGSSSKEHRHSDEKRKSSSSNEAAPIQIANVDPDKFMGDGIEFKGKLIGSELVPDPRGEKMCQNSLQRLKAIVKGTKSHKKACVIRINWDGIKIYDSSNELLYDHPVPMISYIARDESDQRAFGYVFGTPSTFHQFLAIKTAGPASEVMGAIGELFNLVLEQKKREKELKEREGTSWDPVTTNGAIGTSRDAINSAETESYGVFRLEASPNPSSKNHSSENRKDVEDALLQALRPPSNATNREESTLAPLAPLEDLSIGNSSPASWAAFDDQGAGKSAGTGFDFDPFGLTPSTNNFTPPSKKDATTRNVTQPRTIAKLPTPPSSRRRNHSSGSGSGSMSGRRMPPSFNIPDAAKTAKDSIMAPLSSSFDSPSFIGSSGFDQILTNNVASTVQPPLSQGFTPLLNASRNESSAISSTVLTSSSSGKPHNNSFSDSQLSTTSWPSITPQPVSLVGSSFSNSGFGNSFAPSTASTVPSEDRYAPLAEISQVATSIFDAFGNSSSSARDDNQPSLTENLLNTTSELDQTSSLFENKSLLNASGNNQSNSQTDNENENEQEAAINYDRLNDTGTDTPPPRGLFEKRAGQHQQSVLANIGESTDSTRDDLKRTSKGDEGLGWPDDDPFLKDDPFSARPSLIATSGFKASFDSPPPSADDSKQDQKQDEEQTPGFPPSEQPPPPPKSASEEASSSSTPPASSPSHDPFPSLSMFDPLVELDPLTKPATDLSRKGSSTDLVKNTPTSRQSNDVSQPPSSRSPPMAYRKASGPGSDLISSHAGGGEANNRSSCSTPRNMTGSGPSSELGVAGGLAAGHGATFVSVPASPSPAYTGQGRPKSPQSSNSSVSFSPAPSTRSNPFSATEQSQVPPDEDHQHFHHVHPPHHAPTSYPYRDPYRDPYSQSPHDSPYASYHHPHAHPPMYAHGGHQQTQHTRISHGSSFSDEPRRPPSAVAGKHSTNHDGLRGSFQGSQLPESEHYDRFGSRSGSTDSPSAYAAAPPVPPRVPPRNSEPPPPLPPPRPGPTTSTSSLSSAGSRDCYATLPGSYPGRRPVVPIESSYDDHIYAPPPGPPVSRPYDPYQMSSGPPDSQWASHHHHPHHHPVHPHHHPEEDAQPPLPNPMRKRPDPRMLDHGAYYPPPPYYPHYGPPPPPFMYDRAMAYRYGPPPDIYGYPPGYPPYAPPPATWGPTDMMPPPTSSASSRSNSTSAYDPFNTGFVNEDGSRGYPHDPQAREDSYFPTYSQDNMMRPSSSASSSSLSKQGHRGQPEHPPHGSQSHSQHHSQGADPFSSTPKNEETNDPYFETPRDPRRPDVILSSINSDSSGGHKPSNRGPENPSGGSHNMSRRFSYERENENSPSAFMPPVSRGSRGNETFTISSSFSTPQSSHGNSSHRDQNDAQRQEPSHAKDDPFGEPFIPTNDQMKTTSFGGEEGRRESSAQAAQQNDGPKTNPTTEEVKTAENHDSPPERNIFRKQSDPFADDFFS